MSVIYFKKLTYQGKDIKLFNGKSIAKITINGISYFPQISKLATPTNGVITGTMLEFDSVENATRYNIIVDGKSIGYVDAAAINAQNSTQDNNPVKQEGIS